MTMVRELLKAKFGFDDFRPGQEAVIDHLLDGHSSAAVFPTGSGKSLCYQLPALLFEGVTIVVSPLIALMKEQIDRLQSLGISADRLDSSRTFPETLAIQDKLRSKELRLLYIAPERFNNERFREKLQSCQVSLFAVDEAHCISEWGHNFRPDYLKLLHFSEMCKAERILALTATATPRVLADICKGFRIDPSRAVRTGFYRPNLTVLTTPVAEENRDALLLERLREREHGPTIVYVTLQRTAERVATGLAETGFPARAYHAGMKTEDRTEVQDWFAASDDSIVVATIAFGMGIDKRNIRAVYHYNLPKSLENFSQEIGRAGRDGESSVCETLAVPEDLNALENFVYGDTPAASSIRSLLDEVFRQGDEFALSLYDLAHTHDIRQLVLRTLMTYLQLDGYLEEGTPYFSRYRIKPMTTSQEMLGHFEGERREFLTKVLAVARKAKIWYDIDLDRAAEAAGSPRERVVRALDYLSDQRLLELQADGVRHRYRKLRDPDSVADLAEELTRRTLDREEREIERLGQVIDLISLDACQVRHLGKHFGEDESEPCGHCSWCERGGQAEPMPERATPPIDPVQWRQALALRENHPEALGEPRAFARFVCGSASPRATREKLTRNPLFGFGECIPFREVLRRLE